MITKFTLPCDLSIETSAKIIEDTPLENVSNGVKIFIPSLMAQIQYGDPCVSIATTQGYHVFKNAKSCRPVLSSTILRQQNYMTANLLNNSSLESITITEYNKDKKKIYKQYIPKDSTIRSIFLNGKLSKLYFNTDISDTPDGIESEEAPNIDPSEHTQTDIDTGVFYHAVHIGDSNLEYNDDNKTLTIESVNSN